MSSFGIGSNGLDRVRLVSGPEPTSTGFFDPTRDLLSGGTGITGIDAIDTQVDRMTYGLIEGGTSKWAFGGFRTWQSTLYDALQGYDPEVHLKPDPEWKGGENIGLPPSAKAAVLYLGGEELLSDIQKNSVSAAHMQQRIAQAEQLVRATIAMEKYDEQAGYADFILTKTTSGIVNYIGSDPSTALATIATAGFGTLPALAARGVPLTASAVMASRSLSVGQKVALIARHNTNSIRVATYLFDGLDGASSGYSGWKATNDQIASLYGSTREVNDNWMPETAIGAVAGTAFNALGDITRAMHFRNMRGMVPPNRGVLSAVENSAANIDGHLGTEADELALNAWFSAKSRLEKSLDLTEGPESAVRRRLLDDESRGRLGLGSAEEMDSFAKWVEESRPSSAEIASELNKRQTAFARADTVEDGLEAFLEGGGDRSNFYRRKSSQFVNEIAGEESGKYRFLIDWLEEATGDARIVASWLARADKETLVRATNAINANSAIGKLEADALERARVGQMELWKQAGRQNAAERQMRFENAVRLGKWRSAVLVLNELHTEVLNRAGAKIVEIESIVADLNKVYGGLNEAARRRLGSFERIEKLMVELRYNTSRHIEDVDEMRKAVAREMSETADVADVVAMAHRNERLVNFAGRQRLDAINNLRNAILDEAKKLQRATELVEARYGSAVDMQSDIVRIARAGRASIEKTVRLVDDFPLVEARLSNDGYEAVMNGARQATKLSNRWKMDFVDLMMGQRMSDNAVDSGTMPMRPVLAVPKPAKVVTVKDVDRLIDEEMKAIEPEINKIREGARELSVEDKIKADNESAARLRTSAEAAANMALRPGVTKKQRKAYAAFAQKRIKLAERLERLAKRRTLEMEGRIDVLNKDLAIPETPRARMLAGEAARVDAAKAAHDAAAARLMKMSIEDPAGLAKAAGRKLRDKVRKLAVEVGGGTQYQKARREVGSLTSDIEKQNNLIADLQKKGSTDADPQIIAARAEIKYLNESLSKVNKTIAGIEGRRPAMIRRYSLNSNEPKIGDIVDLSRLRARARFLKESGDTRALEDTLQEIYNKYGNATEIDRWTELEDRYYQELAKPDPGSRILNVTTEGRNVRLVIERDFKGVDEEVSPEALAKMAEAEKAAVTEKAAKKTGLAERTRRRNQSAEAAAVNEMAAVPTPAPTTETVVIRPRSAFSGADPSKTKMVDKTTGATIEAPADLDEGKKKILAFLTSGEEGERLLIAQDAVAAMGRIPGLQGLGRIMLRFMTQGSGFGTVHTVSRALDMMVRVYNLMDAPEAIVKDLGQRSHARTFQNCKQRCSWISNQVVSAIQRHNLGRDSFGRLDTALISRNTSALNPGELEVYNLMREGYDMVAEARRRSGKSVIDNYYAREGNPAVIRNDLNRAVDDFTNALRDHFRNADVIPDSLADRLSLPRGSNYAALTPERQAAIDADLDAYAATRANEIVSRLAGGIVTDPEGGYRIATGAGQADMNRSLEDSLVGDARLRRYYIADPTQAFRQYMATQAPGDMFDAALSDMFGFHVTMGQILNVLGEQVGRMPAAAQVEFANSMRVLRDKWNASNGFMEYTYSSLFNPTLRASSALVKARFGSFWGLAGSVTEVPRQLIAAKMYGGSMRSVFDLIHAARNAGNMEVLEDVVHGLDQMNDPAHSAFGTDVGTTIRSRLFAPWERFWGVASGSESMMESGQRVNRAGATAISAAEAVGSNAVRLGGMQYFSGVARIVADCQAKRWIAGNVQRMRRLAESLEGIGSVAEQTPEAIARFKNAARQAGIDWDLALRLNHNGLLNRDVLDNIERALGGRTGVFMMRNMRAQMDDRSFTALMSFIVEAQNFAVPVTSFATSVNSRNALVRAMYMLTSYARSFALNVGFRTATSGKMSNTLSLFAAIAIGENIYQTIRSYALGKSEDLTSEYERDPVGTFMKNAVKSPWLGAHTNLAMSGVGMVTGIDALENSTGRGNNLIQPVQQMMKDVSNTVFSDKPIDETTGELFKNYSPLRNAWYTRLMVDRALEN